MTPILELRNINYSYHTPEGETKALAGISFSLSPGEFTAVVGPSGCGKSTLLSLIAGLMRPESGEIFLDGAPLTRILQKSAICCSTTISLMAHQYTASCPGAGDQRHAHCRNTIRSGAAS